MGICKSLQSFWNLVSGTARTADVPVSNLFLVVRVKNPDESRSWEKENLAVDLTCVEGQIVNENVESGMYEATIRILHRDLDRIDKAIINNIQPGQWIECTGRWGGQFGDWFFPSTLVVRQDLKFVKDLPNPETDLNGFLECDKKPRAFSVLKP